MHDDTEPQSAPNVFSPRLVFPAAALARVPPYLKPDQLLKASIRDEPIVLDLLFPMNDDAERGDTLQLTVDGRLVGEAMALDLYEPGDTLHLVLAAADRPFSLVEDRRVVRINYEVYYGSGSGGNEYGPNDQTFVTDVVRPGRDSLSALSIDPLVIAYGITPASLVDDGSGQRYLRTVVKGYDTKAIGDLIVGRIDDMLDTDVRHVTQDDLGKDIELRMPESLLLTIDGGTHTFSYRITDRAGNLSQLAAPVDIAVRLSDWIADLRPPLIPDAADGLITTDDAHVRGGVNVVIPGHPSIKRGDAIVLWWNRHASAPYRVSPGDESKDPLMAVVAPYALVYADWNASANENDLRVVATVTYELWRDALPVGRAVSALVQVNLFAPGSEDPLPETPVHEGLRPLLVRSASGVENAIPWQDFGLPATLIIPWLNTETPPRTAFRAGDIIEPVYAGDALESYTVTPDDESRAVDVTLSLDGARVVRGGGGDVEADYRATRYLMEGGINVSPAPSTVVIVDAAWIVGGRSGYGPYYYANPNVLAPVDLGTESLTWIYDNGEKYTGTRHRDVHPERRLDVSDARGRYISLRPRNISGIFSYGSPDSGCALRDDGTLRGWGPAGMLPPAGTADVVQVAQTRSAYAAVRCDGSVVAWGDGTAGGIIPKATRSALEDVVRVIGTGRAFLALLSNRSVVTWGDPDAGGYLPPGLASDLRDIVDIVSSDDAFAVRRDDGEVFCWGGVDLWPYGMHVIAARDARSLCASNRAFSALLPGGTVVAWGDPSQGGSIPVNVLPDLTEIVHLASTSQAFAALSDDGKVTCWGEPRFGGEVPALPFPAATLQGSTTAFAITSAGGDVFAWGQPGEGATVPPDLKVTTLTAGHGSFAALTRSGGVHAWGLISGIVDTRDAVAVYPGGSSFIVLTSSGHVIALGAHAPDLSDLTGQVTHSMGTTGSPNRREHLA